MNETVKAALPVGYPAEYDHDAYEPILARASAGSSRMVRIGVSRRPQAEIDRRRALRAASDMDAGLAKALDEA